MRQFLCQGFGPMRLGRQVAVLAMVALSAAVFVSAAAGAEPTKFDLPPDTFTSTVTGVCAFPVSVSYTVSGTETDFVDQSGALTMIHLHVVEQDVFSANGKTLTGLPYTFNIDVLFDSSGNLTHVYASGVVSRVPLPDGTVFFTAGRNDFVLHPGVDVLIQPDRGAQGDVAGFCAALSP
jgi:hypothetical protein